MTRLTALDLLWRFESHLGDLYLLVAETLDQDPVAAGVFARLALDEYSHAQQVAYQRRLIVEDPRLFVDIALDEAELYRATAKIKRMRDRSGPLSVGAAIAAAIEFESSAADYHSRMALRQANADFAGFLVHLGRADAEHRKRLEDLVETIAARSSATARTASGAPAPAGTGAGGQP